jgi:hypothetical protein
MLYAPYWVIPRRLNSICRRFRTLCLFHLHRWVGTNILHTYQPMKMSATSYTVALRANFIHRIEPKSHNVCWKYAYKRLLWKHVTKALCRDVCWIAHTMVKKYAFKKSTVHCCTGRTVKCTVVQALRFCTGCTVKCTVVRALRLCTGRTVNCTVVQALRLCTGRTVKCTLVQALRLSTGHTAHRGIRGIALPFHDHGTRRGWVVSITPWPLFTPGKDPGPTAQEAGRVPAPVWTGVENLALTPGFDPWTVQPVASRYTDYTTRPTRNIGTMGKNVFMPLREVQVSLSGISRNHEHLDISL